MWICPDCRRRVSLTPELIAQFPGLRCVCNRLVEWQEGQWHVGQPARVLPRVEGGPGTELTALFAEVSITEKVGCDCKAVAAEMNRAGVVGCRERRAEFLARLEKNATKYNWWEKLKAGGNLVGTGTVFRTGLTLDGLFDEAIRRAELKALGGNERLEAIGPVAIQPLWRHRFPTGELLLADHCLNPSIITHAGRTYLAYRRGWGNARIALAELDADFRILWQKQLDLPLRDLAGISHEDPRLFVFRGRLHVAYTGCHKRERTLQTSVCYARLSEDGAVEADFQPRYVAAAFWEKNWSFFDAGRLHAIYWHGGQRRILRIDGDRADLIHDYQQDLPFAGGELRGGASPIYHDGQWYVFFHGVAGEGIERIYSAGLYTFDPDPPFRIRRFIRQPLLLPTLSERPVPTVPHCVYPAGAMLRDGKWIVSLGNYDHYCELAAFEAAALEGLLT